METYNTTWDDEIQSLEFNKVQDEFGSETATHKFRQQQGTFLLVVRPIVFDGVSGNSFKIRVSQSTSPVSITGEITGMVLLIVFGSIYGFFCTIQGLYLLCLPWLMTYFGPTRQKTQQERIDERREYVA